MAGSELVGDKEFEQIKELFERDNAILYRYHPSGFMVDRFESRIAERLGVRYAHAVSSGTAAIETALWAVGVGPGDEVITTAFTFVAPIEAIISLGAVPVCVEIDDTLHMDPDAVEAAITARTKAVCAVPMWGAYDVARIKEICDRHEIALVEDAAQSLGVTYRGRYLGSFGIVGSFSLDFGKTLTAGEGGFVVTDDEDTYRRVAEYSDHGHVHDMSVPRGQDGVRRPGFNYRMSELTAAIANGQLSRFDDILRRQRGRRAHLQSHIEGRQGVWVRRTSDPEGEPGDTLIVTLETAAAAQTLTDRLTDNGVGTKILPEAFAWHFAGSWSHVWGPILGDDDPESLRTRWPTTYELLSRSVALGISVIDNEAWDAGVVRAFDAALSAESRTV